MPTGAAQHPAGGLVTDPWPSPGRWGHLSLSPTEETGCETWWFVPGQPAVKRWSPTPKLGLELRLSGLWQHTGNSHTKPFLKGLTGPQRPKFIHH